MSETVGQMPPVVVEFNAVFDDRDGPGMWTVRSDSAGITTEAATKEAVMRRLAAIVPDVLESRAGRVPANVHIRVIWQELRTVDRTEPAIA